MDSNAKAYSTLNKPQYELGCEYIRALNLSPGNKVLDMGCGTGEVVRVDPDEARIKVGQEKFKDAKNVDFQVGSSLSGFPHDNDEYYDLHFSSSVFHWLKLDEKSAYLRKAYQSLKAGGRVAILTALKERDNVAKELANTIQFLGEGDYKELVRDGGFNNIDTQVYTHSTYFSSVVEFAAWCKASCHLDLKDFDQEWVKAKMAERTSTEPDGRLKFDMKNIIKITATK